jgi:hypothetical protein
MSLIVFSPSFTLEGTIVYGTGYNVKRINQSRRETIDGGDLVFDSGPNIGYGTIILKNVSYENGELFRSYLRNNLNFMRTLFTITPPTGLNLGNGRGIMISYCRLLKSTDDGIFDFVAPGVYNITLEYKFIFASAEPVTEGEVEYDTSTGEIEYDTSTGETEYTVVA